MREPLDARRHCETMHFDFSTAPGAPVRTYTMTAGFYDVELTRLGEVFLSAAKSGTDVEVNARDGAIAVSLALQHGVPLQTLAHAMTRNGDGSPSGPLGAALDLLAKGIMERCQATAAKTKEGGAAE